MSFVHPRLKEPCNCGDARCKAFGAIKPDGHSRHCWDGCEACAKPKKPKRRTIPQPVRRKVTLRSQDQCEFRHNGHRCQHFAEHMHHKRRRSQGGADSVSNIVHLCAAHHELVHRNPEFAVAIGMLVEAGGEK